MFCLVGDEFKPEATTSSESEDEGSSGVDEEDVSDINRESEIDSPMKVALQCSR
jgi:hypothetical protein